jgi:hypothetical protein
MLRRGCVVLVAAGAMLAGAATANASFLVYLCGPNLCRINPDGTGKKPLTSDGQAGTAHAYGGPSLSRNGSKLSFVYFEQVYVGDANAKHRTGAFPNTHTAVVTAMRPDGGQLLELEDTFSFPAVDVCTYNLDGSGRNCPYGAGAANWAPDGNLLIDTQLNTANEIICKVAVAANQPCTDVIAQDPNSDLYDPAVSPNGSTLAVTVTSGIGTSVTGHIALYNYATGQLERNLTDGTNDDQPMWSPDGSQIAFDRGSSIYVINVNGSPGSEYRLTSGNSPTWGGGANTKLSLRLAAHQSPVKNKKITSTVRCSAACYMGAYAVVKIGSASPFGVVSRVFHLTKAGSKQVPLAFSHKQLGQLHAGLRAHKRIVATIRGVLTNANGKADLMQTSGKRVVIRS